MSLRGLKISRTGWRHDPVGSGRNGAFSGFSSGISATLPPNPEGLHNRELSVDNLGAIGGWREKWTPFPLLR